MKKSILDTTFRELLNQEHQHRFSYRVSTLTQPISTVILDALTAVLPPPVETHEGDVTNLRTLFGFVYEAAFEQANPDYQTQVEVTLDGISGHVDFYDPKTATVIDTKCVASTVASKLKGATRGKNIAPPNLDYLGYESQVKAYMWMLGATSGALHVIDRGYLNKVIHVTSVPTQTFWESVLSRKKVSSLIIEAISKRDFATLHSMLQYAIERNEWHPYSVYRNYGNIFTKGAYGVVTGTLPKETSKLFDLIVSAVLTVSDIKEFYDV